MIELWYPNSRRVFFDNGQEQKRLRHTIRCGQGFRISLVVIRLECFLAQNTALDLGRHCV